MILVVLALVITAVVVAIGVGFVIEGWDRRGWE